MDLEDQLNIAAFSQRQQTLSAIQKANELEKNRQAEAERLKKRQDLLFHIKQEFRTIEYLFKNKKHIAGCFNLKKNYELFNEAEFSSEEFPTLEYKDLLNNVLNGFDESFKWIKANVRKEDFYAAEIRLRNLKSEINKKAEQAEKQIKKKRHLSDKRFFVKVFLSLAGIPLFIYLGKLVNNGYVAVFGSIICSAVFVLTLLMPTEE